MRYAATCLLVLIATSSALAQTRLPRTEGRPDRWRRGNPARGINDDNIDERIGGLTEMIDGAQSERERIRLYQWTVRDLESRLKSPESQVYVLDLVENALALEPEGRARIDILLRGASSAGKTLGTHGAPIIANGRARAITYQVRAVREILDSIESANEKYAETDEAFRSRYSAVGEQTLAALRPGRGSRGRRADGRDLDPALAGMDPEQVEELRRDYFELIFRKRSAEGLQRTLDRTPAFIGRLYSSLDAGDLSEAERIIAEHLGDHPFAQKMLWRARGDTNRFISNQKLGARTRHCGLCYSVQEIELLDPPTQEEIDTAEYAEREWVWEYKFVFARDLHVECQHEWIDGRPPLRLAESVRDGQVVLLRKKDSYGAFILTGQSEGAEATSFVWRFGTDAEGLLDLSNPDVRGSDAPVRLEARAHGARIIKFAKFEVRWSEDGEGNGHIYYTRRPGDTLTPYDMAICVTEATSFADVRPLSEKWIYSKSLADGL